MTGEGEFEEHLRRRRFSSVQLDNGWVLWSKKEDLKLVEDMLVKLKFEDLHDRIPSDLPLKATLIQIWAVEKHEDHLCLSSFNQPFAVSDKSLYQYREQCVSHHYSVDDGVEEWELGAVGRVFRNKHPECCADLRFYSIREFPLRDVAIACNLTSYYVMPLFTSRIGGMDILSAVIEVFYSDVKDGLFTGTKALERKTIHLQFGGSCDDEKKKEEDEADEKSDEGENEKRKEKRAQEHSEEEGVQDKRLKREAFSDLTIEDLLPYMGQKLNDVLKKIGASKSEVRRVCRAHGLARWPWKPEHLKKISMFMQKDVKNDTLGRPIVKPTINIIVVRIKHKDTIFSLNLSRLAGLEVLLCTVGAKFNLRYGSFTLTYKDEDGYDIVLLADVDMKQCFRRGLHKPYLQVSHTNGRQLTIEYTDQATSFEFIGELPREFREYVVSTINVLGDGNCGFRAVAHLMDFGEEEWKKVRRDLKKELIDHKDFYVKLFDKAEYNAVSTALDYFDSGVASKDFWFTLPEMGQLVASVYNIVFVALSVGGSYTFMPLKSRMPESPQCKCMALVNDGTHFIAVTLRSGHPLPNPMEKWSETQDESAQAWNTWCQRGFSHYKDLVGVNCDGKKTIIDLTE